MARLRCQWTFADETGKPVKQLKPKLKQVRTASERNCALCLCQGRYKREQSITLATLRSQLTSVPDDEETDTPGHKESVETRNRHSSLVRALSLQLKS